MIRRGCFFACLLAAALAIGCTGKSQTAPAPPPPPARSNTAAAIFLTPNVWDLPPGGGSIEITIATSASLSGNIVAPDVDVTITASSGELSDRAPHTDRTGHAKVTWSGTSGATITARSGEVVATATFRIVSPAPPFPTPNPPGPLPPGGPIPPRPPGPPPPPLDEYDPAGDLVASITASPLAPSADDPVTLSVGLTSTTGATIPALVRYTWDVNGDLLPDHYEAQPVVVYGEGTVRIDVETFTADHRVVRATRTLAVGPQRLSLGVSASEPRTIGLPVIFVATLRNSIAPAGSSFAWDFDGDGVVDITVVGSARSTVDHTFTAAGTYTSTVTVTATDGRSASATLTITVASPVSAAAWEPIR